MPPVHNSRLPHLRMTRTFNIRKHLRLRQSAHRKRQRLSHQETTPPGEAVSVTDVAASVSLSTYCLRYLLSLHPRSLSETSDHADSPRNIHLYSWISESSNSTSFFPVPGLMIPPILSVRLQHRTYAEGPPFASSHHQNGFASCRLRGLYLKQASQHTRGSLPAWLPHHNPVLPQEASGRLPDNPSVPV